MQGGRWQRGLGARPTPAQLYHEIHDHLIMNDLRPDLYIGFNTGIGHPGYRASWTPSLRCGVEAPALTPGPLPLTDAAARLVMPVDAVGRPVAGTCLRRGDQSS